MSAGLFVCIFFFQMSLYHCRRNGIKLTHGSISLLSSHQSASTSLRMDNFKIFSIRVSNKMFLCTNQKGAKNQHDQTPPFGNLPNDYNSSSISIITHQKLVDSSINHRFAVGCCFSGLYTVEAGHFMFWIETESH